MKQLEDSCVVVLDGEIFQSDDFVAILTKENSDASIYFKTDAMTLGMAIKMVTRAFVQVMNDCTQEERDEITSILGSAFVTEEESDEQD